MERRKMRRKSKAISPIIATLILIVITVVAGVMLYGFVTGFMSKTSSSTAAVGQIVAQSASVSSSHYVQVVVTNTGSSSVTITQVNIVNPNGQLIAYSTSAPSPSTVSAGSTTEITESSYRVTSGQSWPAQGTTVLVQVVTNTGSYAETSTVVGP